MLWRGVGRRSGGLPKSKVICQAKAAHEFKMKRKLPTPEFSISHPSIFPAAATAAAAENSLFLGLCNIFICAKLASVQRKKKAEKENAVQNSISTGGHGLRGAEGSLNHKLHCHFKPPFLKKKKRKALTYQ